MTFISNVTLDLPACSIMPQPTTLPHAPMNAYIRWICRKEVLVDKED
jgi:hypothetical protein